MPNKQIQSLTVEGVTYDIVDNTSGYTKNVGTITEVKTTAGAHTTIDVTSGKAEFKVPTKTSDLTNDSGFLTSYTETDPIFVASAAHGITSTDITNWNNKLDSYTETDPTVPAWAKAETKPSYTFSEINSTPTTISGYGIIDAYTKAQVDGLVASVLHYKGTKPSVADLPTSGNTTGDVWHITADGSEYAWDGSVWQELGTAIDLSEYAIKATTLAGYGISDAKIENGIITLGSNSITPLTSETDPVFSASAAANITTTDIANWNAKVSDTKTWGDVVAPSGRADTSDSRYIPQFSSTSSSSTTTATFTITRVEPFRLGVPKWDLNNYLYAATPSANDNSTKVATTAFVQSAIPTIPTNVSAFTNDAGYITVTDLPEPLIGNTSDITPTQVLTALQAGRDVYITYSHELYGNIIATYFNYSAAFNVIITNIVALYNDGSSSNYMLFSLAGFLENNTWQCVVTALAEKSDIPYVPTNISELYNDSGYITASDVEDEIFIATYNSTSYSDILTAYNNGKIIFCKDGTTYVPLTRYSTDTFYFRFLDGLSTAKQYYVNSSGWSSGVLSLVITTRTINGKSLGSDITLTASDVDALPSSTDVTKWNGISLAKQEVTISGDSYLPTSSTPTGTAAVSFTKATATPTASNLTKYDADAYLNSTTPAAGDSSTKVATTAFVQSAIPTVPTNVSSFTNDAGYITSYTDEKLKVTANTTSGTFYPVLTGATTTAENKKYDTLFSCIRASGTDAAIGIGINGTAKGSLRLYTTTASRYGIITPGTLTDTRTYTLPDQTGTIALTADIPTVPAWAQASTKPTYTASEVGALPDTTEIPEATIAINDSGYIYNGQTVDSKVSGVGISTATNLLTSRNDTYVVLRANSTNPFLGLKCGNNLWYAQAMDDYFYFGPTSTKAMRLDQNGNALFVGTIQADGDLTLYTPSGNSPGIIFQRGTLTDNYNDWKIYDKSGYLYFAQRGSGSSAFGDVGYIDTAGVIRSLTIPWGSVSGKPSFATVATSGSYNDLSDTPAELPTVSASDNGKVLRVVDGAWSAVSLPSASGVSF